MWNAPHCSAIRPSRTSSSRQSTRRACLGAVLLGPVGHARRGRARRTGRGRRCRRTGSRPCSRIQATAADVSRPPEKAMPTRSPTGSDVEHLATSARERYRSTVAGARRRRLGGIGRRRGSGGDAGDAGERPRAAPRRRRWPARRRRAGGRGRGRRCRWHADRRRRRQAEPRQPADVVERERRPSRPAATNGSSMTNSGCGSPIGPEPPRRQAELAAGLPHRREATTRATHVDAVTPRASRGVSSPGARRARRRSAAGRRGRRRRRGGGGADVGSTAGDGSAAVGATRRRG